MNSLRPSRLNSALLCLCGLAAAPHLFGQQNPPAPRSTNPFETVPQAGQTPSAPATRVPQFEAPKQADPGALAPIAEDVIETIQFRGARRVPQDTLRAIIFTKVGDVYNEGTLRRDFMALWNMNRFDDIRLEQEKGERGGTVVTFVVTERPVIRDIKYEGAKSVSTSDILDRFKERKVGLTVESMYDPNIVNRAAVVLKDLVAEHGHEFAVVTPDLRRIPPSSLEVVFKVVEGPKVKVGNITILGNQAFKRLDVIRAMKNSKGIGIPRSILFESIFPATYDSAKLEEDKERVRDAYQKQGYFTAKTLDHTLKLREVGGALGGIHIPLIKENKPGRVQDITVPVEEGPRYYLAKIDFTGVKLFRSTEFLGGQFQMRIGDPFSTEKLRNGLKNLTKIYSQFGYIDYVAEPQIDIVPRSDKINLTLNADEGKQFFVRRIDFTGNTTTRDKVIRREVLIDEGDVYNSSLWDASILRLNQLGYFEALKENEAYELKRNSGSNTVDITLKVRERGKNTIGLNGGVSGIAGTFVGLNYSTNNFLGLGETLSLQTDLGTLQRNVTIGFTEPYVFDRPLQAGISVYLRRFNYDQGRQQSILTGQNLQAFYDSLGSANVLNYVQNSQGISFSASYPIKRSFARLGLAIGYDKSDIVTKSDGAKTYFTYINFLGVNGPNALDGIKTLSVTPSYSFNSKNDYQNPTAGKSIFFSVQASASLLGANVNSLRPTFDLQYYHTSPKWRRNVIALHFLASTVTGFGGKVAPPQSRTFIGGENDVRGFDFYSISPIAFIPSSASVPQLNPDGTQRIQRVRDATGALVPSLVSLNIPTYQIITPGGDTHSVVNLEYRIPVVGPITLVPFFDGGMNKILFPNQLSVNPGQIESLDLQFPQAAYSKQVKVAKGTQAIRISTGIEVQVVLPIVQAPFRIYYAYNPFIVNQNLQPPVAVDRSMFPNNETFLNAVNSYGRAYPLIEKHSSFRFTIGRTF